jgi:3D (Asp-Asp-Asp) domain-containing protein
VRGGRETRCAPVAVAFAIFALAVAVSGSEGAPQGRSSLRHDEALLGSKSHAALLSLYALDSQLTAARERAASLAARLADVRAAQARAVRDRQIAQRAWTNSVHSLAAHLRVLYEQGQPDAVAILFGATSIDDAMSRLDALERSAQLNRQTVEQTRAAQRTLRALQQELATRATELETLAAQARANAASLAQARANRIAYLASLRQQQALTARRIAQLDAAARRSVARSHVVVVQQSDAAAAPISPAAPAPPGPPVTSGQTLTVTATGYALSGSTATGLPVGPGVVAVDPSVIPLGTHLTVPGYGEAVAADVGGAVRGTVIDLWFPTVAQANAWGRRSVTVVLH